MSYTHEALQLLLESQVKAAERDNHIQNALNRIEKQIYDLSKEIRSKERDADMTDEQKCIVELYQFIDDLTEKARKKDSKVMDMFRGGRIGGADKYQGMPSIVRIRDSLLEKHEQVIRDSFKAKEVEDYENQTAHREC